MAASVRVSQALDACETQALSSMLIWEVVPANWRVIQGAPEMLEPIIRSRETHDEFLWSG